ncbi:MAG: sugar ABC transporter permease [Lachnospiraceae bacterium]|nr:sugar ABC transporter permease [Lachnospiraceae bacterium]
MFVEKQSKSNGFTKILYNKKLAPYIFCLPFIISFLIFFLYPAISSFLMSFQKIEGFQNTTWIGLGNYKRLFNVHFFNAIKSSTIYTICMVCIMMILPITIATILNSKIMKCKNFFRSAVFIPTLTSVVVAGISFRLLFGETEGGFFNSIILKLGGEMISWKTGYVTGMIMMVTLAAWRELGINMVYCLSALQSIPAELYEAADIDGCSGVQKFFYVTIPQVKPIIIYILTLSIINGYRMFTEGYVYWNETNPGDIGLTIVRYIYQQAFQRNDFGMGSAIGMVLLVIIMAVNMVQMNLFGMFKKEDD